MIKISGSFWLQSGICRSIQNCVGEAGWRFCRRGGGYILKKILARGVVVIFQMKLQGIYSFFTEMLNLYYRNESMKMEVHLGGGC